MTSITTSSKSIFVKVKSTSTSQAACYYGKVLNENAEKTKYYVLVVTPEGGEGYLAGPFWVLKTDCDIVPSHTIIEIQENFMFKKLFNFLKRLFKKNNEIDLYVITYTGDINSPEDLLEARTYIAKYFKIKLEDVTILGIRPSKKEETT